MRASSRIDLGELEDPACPLCGGRARRPAYRLPPFAVVRCTGCELFYLAPRLREEIAIQLYREADYYEGGAIGYASYTDQESALRATFRRLLDELGRRGIAGGALLEVGCGFGFLLDEAHGRFSSRVGSEYAQRAAAVAASRADQVYHGGIESIPQEARFDCIIATQVIEHLYDPRGFVGRLVGHLQPGGRMVLATPDMGSLWRRLMGSRWPSFKPLEHIIYFDRASLGRLMREAGLTDIGQLPYPHAFPLSLVAAKVGLRLPGAVGRLRVWLPATTFALHGVKS